MILRWDKVQRVGLVNVLHLKSHVTGCSRLTGNDDVVFANLLKFYVIVYDAHWRLNE